MTIPIVTSISPNASYIDGHLVSNGASPILIFGSHFQTPFVSDVTIAGIDLAGTINVLSDTVIQISELPAHAAGTFDVTVTNADGTGTGVGLFTFSSIPVIEYLSVAQGDTSGGTAVGIQGSGFSNVQTVSFGGVEAVVLVDTLLGYWLIVDVPAHSAGLVDVTVMTTNGTVTALNAYTYKTPHQPVFNVYLFDDCCHLWVSKDTGNSYVETVTPNGPSPSGPDSVNTIGDTWTEMLVPFNDGDFENFLCIDFNYSGPYGVICTSPLFGADGSWTYFDPEPDQPAFVQGDGAMDFVSGAYSANGTIVMCPYSWNGLTPTNFYPRLSTDGGGTWNDVTGVPTNVIWSRAAFSANATTMYLKPSGDTDNGFPGATILNPAYLFKSTNSGASWTQLTSGPAYNGTGPPAQDFESQMRLRCSPNGQHVAMFNVSHVFWISHDGGTSWTSKNFAGFFSASFTNRFADVGMSDDGQTIIVGVELNFNVRGFWPGAAVSTDGGTTWADVTANFVFPLSVVPIGVAPAGAGSTPPGFTSVNVSPAGGAMVLTFIFDDFSKNIMYAIISFDNGATWVLTNYFVPIAISFIGLFTATFITPIQTPPPFIPPPGGYIIERFDNRIWPTVENCWCVDCGFTLDRPTPNADLNLLTATGAGKISGVTDLVGGSGYSNATTAQIVDANGLGPGTGAILDPIIVAGVITAITVIVQGTDYLYPAIVINDPANTGSGASAKPVLDTSSTFNTSVPVFQSSDVGSVIRAGYGVAEITQILDSKTVIVNIISPIAKLELDGSFDPDDVKPQTQVAGTWTMTKPISTLYLPQLVGFTVTGIADGQIIPPTLVPANGIITLATPASAIIVGLAFEAQLQSVYLDAGEPTVQGQRKKIAEVTVRVESSAAFQIGANQPDGSVQSPPSLAPPWDNMVDAPTHAIAPFNSPALPLFTGDIRVPVPSGYNTRGQVAVQQTNPLPLQVLDFVPEVLSGDKPSQEAPKRQQRKNGQQEEQ